MSPIHFHRVFRVMVGETLLENRRLRLARVAWTLRNENTPVTRVAHTLDIELYGPQSAMVALFLRRPGNDAGSRVKIPRTCENRSAAYFTT